MKITIDTDAKTFTIHGETNLKEFMDFIRQNFPDEMSENWKIKQETAPAPAEDGNPINIPLDKPFEWPKPYTPYPTNPWPWTNPTPSPSKPKPPWPITPIYCTLSNDPRWSQFATKS